MNRFLPLSFFPLLLACLMGVQSSLIALNPLDSYRREEPLKLGERANASSKFLYNPFFEEGEEGEDGEEEETPKTFWERNKGIIIAGTLVGLGCLGLWAGYKFYSKSVFSSSPRFSADPVQEKECLKLEEEIKRNGKSGFEPFSDKKKSLHQSLHGAIIQKHKDVCCFLLSQEKEKKVQKFSHIPNDEGLSPFHLAVQERDSDIISLLIDYELPLNNKDKYDATPLFYSINDILQEETEDLRIFRLILKNLTPENMKETQSLSPLSHILYRNRPLISGKANQRLFKILKNLLKNGLTGELYEPENNILCSLFESHFSDLKQKENKKAYKKIVNIILEKSPENYINQFNQDGFTPLHTLLSQVQDTDQVGYMVKHLIKKGADIQARIDYRSEESLPWRRRIIIKYVENQTPLHLAVKNKCLRAVKILLKWGADKESKDIKNETPLSMACRSNLLMQKAFE